VKPGRLLVEYLGIFPDFAGKKSCDYGAQPHKTISFMVGGEWIVNHDGLEARHLPRLRWENEVLLRRTANQSLPPCRGKVRMGVESLEIMK
jgi:hypothetical protein